MFQLIISTQFFTCSSCSYTYCNRLDYSSHLMYHKRMLSKSTSTSNFKEASMLYHYSFKFIVLHPFYSLYQQCIQNTFSTRIKCRKKHLNNLRSVKSDISTGTLQAVFVCQEYFTVKISLPMISLEKGEYHPSTMSTHSIILSKKVEYFVNQSC